MNVRELIAALQRCPPSMEVCIWEDQPGEYVPVVEALYEDGSTHIDLLTQPSGAQPVHPYRSCGGECWLCGEEP
jgi:hypothetical protein